VQARIIPVGERFLDYAGAVRKELMADDLRVEIDARDEKVGYKIRSAQLDKIPYMLIVGEKEAEAGTVSVRHRQAGDRGSMTVDDFRKLLSQEAGSMALAPLGVDS
jgi:threonyl-tRNA synthetase